MEAPQQEQRLEVYIVAPGDTLAGIALARNTTPRHVRALNRMWTDAVWPGQRLRVPRRANSPASDNANNNNTNANNNNTTAAANVNTNHNRHSAALSSSAAASSSSVALPLLPRLRALFAQHDSGTPSSSALSLHLSLHLSPLASLRPPSLSSASPSLALRIPARRSAPRDEDSVFGQSDQRVLSVPAVLLRLRPFLAVSGTLTLTLTRLIFLPDHLDPHVRKLGPTALQADLPTVTLVGVRRVKPTDLDRMIEEDVGLQLQEDQRFMEVMYNPHRNKSVIVPRIPSRASSPPPLLSRSAPAVSSTAAGRRSPQSDDILSLTSSVSLYFMLSPQSLQSMRARLVESIEQLGASGSAQCPTLVLPKDYAPTIPGPKDLVQLIPAIMPPLYRSQDKWFLLFSTKVDGISMTTLLNRVADTAPLLLFIQTTGKGERFGAYIGDELERHREHYGSDRSVVFRLTPEFSCWGASGSNSYFLLVNDKGISMGADAQGHVALFIDYELSHGENACVCNI